MLGVFAAVSASDLTPSIPITRTREEGVWLKREEKLKAINMLNMRAKDLIF